MRAVVITRPGGPEVLDIQQVEQPRPRLSEVLVKVRASALNRADVLQRQGRYPAPPGAPQNIPGLEFAGEIAALGGGATRWRAGQRVFGITAGGGHAEYATSHERMLAEIPGNLSWSQAAAVPEAFITAHDALWRQAGLAEKETVLIHAAGSGVGLAAIQLARAKSAIPYGTSRTAEKLSRAREYGLEDGVAVADDLRPLAQKIQQWTQGAGVNVVLDLLGGNYFAADLEVLAQQGRLLLVGTVAGVKTEITLGIILRKRLKIIGTVLRGRSLEEKIAATEAFSSDILPLLAKGALRPVIDREFALSDVRQAHQRMESNESFGKIILRIAD
jgi:putative PIG3 family NAD(P)H quinone oxidoreductase